MKIEIIKDGYRWRIKVNEKFRATVYMDHGIIDEAESLAMDSILKALNTEKDLEKI